PYDDVTADSTLTFTVPQGYTVEKIEFTMTEPVTVVAGTEVTLAGVPYGTITASGNLITVTPYPGNTVANLIGTFVFDVPTGKIFDLSGNPLGTLSATLVVTNVAPVAGNDSYTVAEGGVLTVAARGVLTNDTDFDPTILTAVKVTDPVNGTLTLNTDGSFTYTPAANYHGTDTFTYKANDGLADSNVATVTITVTAVNDAPVAQDQTVTTAEDTAKAITLAATDADGDTLTYAIVAGPTHGTLSGTAPNLTYTPAANYNGPDSFTFKANDGTADSNVATVTITVTPVNDAPVAQDQSVTTAEDTAKAITLVATDADGDTLTYTIVAGPSHGTLSGTAPNLTYTPAANYNGPDSFTFKANDGTIDSNTATVSITVTPVNDAPVAQDQSVTTPEDTAKAITLVATDADGDTLTYAIVAGPSHGTLSGTAPNLTYTPAANYNGPDSFTFKANDGTIDSNVATVTITVTAVNDAPVAQDQSVTTAEDTAKAITLVATDADGDTLTYTIVAQPAHGSVTLVGNVATYTPAANYNGPDSFTFKANDGTTDSNTATVSITVTPVNDAPVAQDQSVTTAEDTAKAITLVATDADGDTLTYAIVAQPAHGSVTLVGNVATYTPAANYNGPDSFTFKANDGTIDSNVATVTITVTPVNDAPVAVDDAYTMNEKDTLTVAAPGVLANDTDVDGDTLTAILVDGVQHGVLTLNADGSFTYTPDEYFNGEDSFTYKAKDAVLESELAVVTITVTPVNDWPIANDDEYEVLTGTELVKDATEGILANDVLLDPDEEVSIQILEGPHHGTLSMNDDGSFTYIPNPGYMGTDTFRYLLLSVRVNAEWSDDATVTIVVKPYMRLFLTIIWR
ncbi:MAG: Ig-like domain-containing protein, partial [Acidobacteriota bacterium]|nr:Ig-like domain-containing protein [Acidobacteriota bacterium]